MISLKRANQGGSVQTFFIIGLLLVIVAIGTARYVQQHGAQVRRDQAIAQAEKQLKTDQASSSSGSTSTSPNNANSGQVTPSTSTASSSAQSSTSATSGAAVVVQSSDLPTTGPSATSIVNVLLIGLLSAVTTAYLSSRRQLARSL